MNRLPDPLEPWLRQHRKYQTCWVENGIPEAETADDRFLRRSMEDDCLSGAAPPRPADETSRSKLRAVTFGWLARADPPGASPDSGDVIASTALTLCNHQEAEARQIAWCEWEESERVSREPRLDRLQRQSHICHDVLGLTRTQTLLRLSAGSDRSWIGSLQQGFEAADDTFLSLLRDRRIPHTDGLDCWRLEHGCQQSERYPPQAIESRLSSLQQRHPRKSLLHIKRRKDTFLSRNLPLVEGGPVLVVSGASGTGALSDALDAFGRASRAATLVTAEKLDQAFFGDPATELAAGFLFRWTHDDVSLRIADRIRLQTKTFLAGDAESFEAGSGSVEDSRSGIAGSLPMHPGWRAARMRANPLAVEVLRAAAYAVLQEEWLKTRFGTRWLEEREAWRLLEDLWVSEVDSTAEKVAEAYSLGKIESAALLDRWDPRRIFE